MTLDMPNSSADALIELSIKMGGERVFSSYSYSLAAELAAQSKSRWLDHGFGQATKLYYYHGPNWVVVLEEKNSNG